jgi:hypothetical protein
MLDGSLEPILFVGKRDGDWLFSCLERFVRWEEGEDRDA